MQQRNEIFDPNMEQLDFIAGDPQQQGAAVQQGTMADPWGTGAVGHHSTVRLDRSAIAHPLVRWRDRLIECDIYLMPGQAFEGASTDKLEVILICPKCEHELRVTSDRKKIEWTPPAAPEVDPVTKTLVVRGKLSIEKFQCTWEIDTHTNVTGHGENLCRWSVTIDNNRAVDDR